MVAVPSFEDYVAAVQYPELCFLDSELQRGSTDEGQMGEPDYVTGQYSIVFPVTSPSGRRYAVKCFTSDSAYLLARYQMMHARLAELKPTWAVEFVFQSNGIRVNGEIYPILRMDWIEAPSLLNWLELPTTNQKAIIELAASFYGVAQQLTGVGIAHGDLQHGNILVEKGSRPRLIDYDGMYFNGLDQIPPTEEGLDSYQSPKRTSADYGPSIDNFSTWLIFLSLRALAADVTLLDALNPPPRGEFLLLSRADFLDPSSSARLKTLREHSHPAAQELARRISALTKLAIDTIPPLSGSVRGYTYSSPSSSTSPTPDWILSFPHHRQQSSSKSPLSERPIGYSVHGRTVSPMPSWLEVDPQHFAGAELGGCVPFRNRSQGSQNASQSKNSSPPVADRKRRLWEGLLMTCIAVLITLGVILIFVFSDRTPPPVPTAPGSTPATSVRPESVHSLGRPLLL